MNRSGRPLALGAVLAAVAVAAGAFGAHALATRLEPHALALWETAARYLTIGGFGAMIVGLADGVFPGRGFGRAAILLAVGALIFAATVFALALGAPRWLGAVTPLGGLGMIAGFGWAAMAAMAATAAGGLRER